MYKMPKKRPFFFEVREKGKDETMTNAVHYTIDSSGRCAGEEGGRKRTRRRSRLGLFKGEGGGAGEGGEQLRRRCLERDLRPSLVVRWGDRSRD